jgi:2-dehydro-3-deoxygalactonokinase
VTPAFIALDWGTTSFRGYQAAADGTVLDTVAAPQGVLSVQGGAFDGAMENAIGAWDTRLPVLAAGMITSRQGWHDVPYVPCPAGLKEIAAGVLQHGSLRGRRIYFVSGLSSFSRDGTPDVLRGEETQVLGASKGGLEHFLAPGTHNKWIDVEDGIIRRFTTYVTGEAYAVFKQHSILGRLMNGERDDEDAFLFGVKKGLSDPAGLLHHLFSVRSMGLYDRIKPNALPSYMSGLLIGSEIGHARKDRSAAASYTVLASPHIAARYVKAMSIVGLDAKMGEPNIAVKGLARIARATGLIA